jgi:hypothetical protein
MELILIAFVGTALLMVAELRDFIQRGRTHSVATESFSARSHSATRVPAHKSVAAENDDFYDAAA